MALSAFAFFSFLKPLSPLLSSRRALSIPFSLEKGNEFLYISTLSQEKPRCQIRILGALHRSIETGLDEKGANGHSHRSLILKDRTLEETRVESVDFYEADGKNSSTMPMSKIIEPEFRMTLSELMEHSGIVPMWVYGNVDVFISRIQIDSRKVTPGDLFVCCVGSKTDGHFYVAHAVKRGAVAVVASKGVDLDGLSGCKALVIVEDTNSLLPILASTFYKNPSRSMSVVGITGTNGKTTTAHLVRSIYGAMSLRTGMLGTIGYYLHGDIQLEVPNTTPDAVMVQKLMAEMLSNGSEAVVMEASSHGLAMGRCNEVDFNVAVFTNLTRDHYDFHWTEKDYRNSKAKLFARMVNPKRHRKVINIDDPNAPFFIAQGNKDVPIMTFGMENTDANVYPLKFELSLRSTEVLISTPKGILEISSGLIGRHNVYNILAAVAVGVAVGAPLEDIKRGTELVDGVSGRFELVDEEQPFGVVVDFAHTPDALSRILDTVRELGARRIITVVGCAGESDRGKRSIMTQIATDKSEVVILTSDNPKSENPLDILDDMLAGVGWTMLDYVQHGQDGCSTRVPNGHQLFVHNIRRVAVRAAIAMAEKGDIVIVAGRGHETYQLEGDRKKYIDDREECREALRYVDKLRRVGLDKRIPMMVFREPLMSFSKDVEALYKPKEQSQPSLAMPVC